MKGDVSMNKKLIRNVAFAVSAFALVCTAALAKGDVWGKGSAGVEMKAGEFKLLLAQDLFKGSRLDGYRAAWNRVVEVAAGLGWKAETEDDLTKGTPDENPRVYSYPDTVDGVLHSKFYTLRQRIPVKKTGALNTEKADLTLKYSAKDGKAIPLEAFLKGLPEGTKAKAEVNVYGYVDKEAGKDQEHATMQVTFKKQPVMTGTETVAWFAQKYPVIGTLGIPAETVVSMPTSKYIISYATNVGKLKRGDAELEVESCVWYNKDTGEFVCAEVSWRAEAKDADASYELFDAVQRQAPEILDAGRSKNACIK